LGLTVPSFSVTQAYIDFTKSKDLVKDVKAATKDGLGPHAVLLLAVSETPFQQAAGYVRSRGTIVAIGLPANAYLKAPVFDTVIRMITMKGSYVGNRKDGDEAIDFFARGLIKAPFKVVPLSDLPKVYELMGWLTLKCIKLPEVCRLTVKQNKARFPAATFSRYPSKCDGPVYEPINCL
jgi:D-arabinose 1-dehydrogenase-like Zn-dependent alcohol dehydrogenase